MSDEPISNHDSSETPPAQPRRSWLVQAVTGLISTAIIAIPGALAGIFFLDPLFRKKGGAEASGDLDGMIRLSVTRSLIPDDGTPVPVTVKSDLDDAWNRFRDVPVGSIWIRKNPDGSVVSFNSKCPHLGCSVDYRRSEKDFYCPCHTSSFSLDGTKTNDVPPRDMDSLELITATDGQPDADGNELWVRFQNFRGATSDKIAV